MNEDSGFPQADAWLCLEWSVRALAQEAEIQFSLYPPFVCVPDELALEFDECLRAVSSSEQNGLLTPSQAQALKKLDAILGAMSGPSHSELWTEEALRMSAQWKQLRAQARQVIQEMGWSTDTPPKERANYVGPDA